MFQYSNLYFKKLPRHWKMSILHIFNVTDSWWKKSHWATSSVCLCHRISSTAAFSQMMRKLLSQLQHPLFFFSPSSPSYPGAARAQSQPLLRMSQRCPSEAAQSWPRWLAPKASPTLPSPGPAPQCSGLAFPAGTCGNAMEKKPLPAPRVLLSIQVSPAR